MKISIDIDNYLSEDEIKNCCCKAIYDICRSLVLGKDLETFITNSCYKSVWDIVDQSIESEKGLESIISERITRIIENLSSYSVFRHKDEFNNYESVGQKILDNAVKNSRDLIRDKVEEIIDEYPFDELKSDIKDVVYECISDRLGF